MVVPGAVLPKKQVVKRKKRKSLVWNIRSAHGLQKQLQNRIEIPHTSHHPSPKKDNNQRRPGDKGRAAILIEGKPRVVNRVQRRRTQERVNGGRPREEGGKGPIEEGEG